jgi:hypothetical protein
MFPLSHVLNNIKTSFSQFKAKTKHLKPTQNQTHFDTIFCSSLLSRSPISLSSQSMLPFHELGIPLEIVELEGCVLISFFFHFENKRFNKLKNT